MATQQGPEQLKGSLSSKCQLECQVESSSCDVLIFRGWGEFHLNLSAVNPGKGVELELSQSILASL